MALTTGESLLLGAGIGIAVIAVVAMSGGSTSRPPLPGEKRLMYRGKSFKVYPSQSSPNGRGWVLDIGDEEHVHDSSGRQFATSTAAVQFAHKRLNSSDPPRFY